MTNHVGSSSCNYFLPKANTKTDAMMATRIKAIEYMIEITKIDEAQDRINPQVK